MLKRTNKTKNAEQKDPAQKPKGRPAEHTLAEIFSQPQIWSETEAQLKKSSALEKLAGRFSPRSPWLFIGCGSSYYLSQIVTLGS